MKILIDIGHPAHVHYFRNFIAVMKEKGHEFLVIARDKEVSLQLLQAYNIPYVPRGKGGKKLTGKFLYLFKGELLMLYHARKFKPDLFIGMSSTLAAHVSKMMGKASITLDDTEHAKFELILYPPFTNTILTPQVFQKNLGNKQIRFNGFLEQCYLHPNYFTPNFEIISRLGIGPSEKYTLVRFVSWEAGHDVGKKHFNNEFKIELVKTLSSHSKVFISSECPLPSELEPFKLHTRPEEIHDVLAFASLFVGEGATMASECAMLSVPAVYVNVLTAGTLEEQARLGLLNSYRSEAGVIEKAVEMLTDNNIIQKIKKEHKKMMQETIDVTSFLVWFVENYPESAKTMKTNPEYQNRFC